MENRGLNRVYLDHPAYGKETVGEFLSRHKIPVQSNGRFVLYHGRPKGSEYKTLRPGTYLTDDPDSARFFAARDRGLDPGKDIEVIPLDLTADDIEPGIHITLRREYEIV